MVYAFGPESEWELDEELWELRHRGERLRIQPKVLALLFHLARNARRVVASDELLRELWPDEVVTKSSLARAVSLARSLLAGRGARDVLETVPRRGYRFRGVTTSPGARDLDADPLVGRESLLAELWREYAAASGGEGRVVVLRGDAGIGKTRLLEEIARRARADGVAVLSTWCSSDSGQPPLWPWARIARDALELEPALARRLGGRLAALHELAGTARARDGAGAPLAAGSGSEMRAGSETFRLVDGLVALLRAVAAERPLVVALDDLQWADRASLRVLELCARDLLSARVLLVAALRDDELAQQVSLHACLAALERLAQTRSWRLEPLPRRETAALIEHLWGEAPPREIVEAIWGAGLGNPLFTRELVRHVRAGGTGLLPATVRVLLEDKLARLSASARELLRTAALAGAEPSLELVRAVRGGDAAAFARSIAELAERGLAAAASGTPRLRFAHPLVRETAIAARGGAQRVELHERIAREFERLGAADPDSIASEVAEHRLAAAREGGDAARAAEWAERAARVALRRCAYDDAATGFARALEALRLAPAVDPRRELALLLCLGDAHAHANQLAEGAAAAEAAAARARRLGDPDSLARAALLVFVRGAESGGPYDRVLRLLQEAEERTRSTGGRLRARVTARLAHELFFTPGTIARRVALADEARGLADRDADLETRLFVGYHSLIGTWSRVRARERAALTAGLTALADEARDPAARFMVSAPYLASHLECGRIDEVDAEIEMLARRVETLEVPSFFAWYPHVYRAMRALLDGRLDAAERLMSVGLELGLRAQTQDAQRNFAGQRAQLLRERGRDAEAEPDMRAMRARFAAISVWRAGWVRTLALAGKRDEASDELRDWLRTGLPDPLDDSNGVISLVLLADAAAELGDVEAAGELYPRLEPYSGENAAPAFAAVFLGPVDLALGRLAAALGRREGALALLESAERSAERIGARPALARARLARARVLVTQPQTGELAQGRALAAAGAALADAVGMPEVSRRAREVSDR